MANRWLGLVSAVSVMTLLQTGCIDASDPVDDPTTEPAPIEEDIVERYVRAMCIDDFRAAKMTEAWANTTMYPHEAALCSACHQQGQHGFLAPSYGTLTTNPEYPLHEQVFFNGLRGSASNRSYLFAYVVPVPNAGEPTMLVNRAGMENIANGAAGHEKFALDEQPGMAALQHFHELTMQRMRTGSGCASPQ